MSMYRERQSALLIRTVLIESRFLAFKLVKVRRILFFTLSQNKGKIPHIEEQNPITQSALLTLQA
jgi:hypothetical protein